MRIKEYERQVETPLRQSTVILHLRGNEVLLAMKKRGFGVGKWNGVGGKVDLNEEIIDAAIRESQEEIGVTPVDPKKVAIFNYHFPHQKDWGQQVHIFTVTTWLGEPSETEEMRPQWFNLGEIPYSEMWSDDEIWMPKIFSGQLLQGSFMFDKEGNVLDYYMVEDTDSKKPARSGFGQ